MPQISTSTIWYVLQNQDDRLEYLLMLIEVINKGSVHYCCPNDDISTGVSLSDGLFSFMLKKYTVCEVCGLRSPSYESSSVLYISPAYSSSVQESTMQGMLQK